MIVSTDKGSKFFLFELSDGDSKLLTEIKLEKSSYYHFYDEKNDEISYFQNQIKKGKIVKLKIKDAPIMADLNVLITESIEIIVSYEYDIQFVY